MNSDWSKVKGCVEAEVVDDITATRGSVNNRCRLDGRPAGWPPCTRVLSAADKQGHSRIRSADGTAAFKTDPSRRQNGHYCQEQTLVNRLTDKSICSWFIISFVNGLLEGKWIIEIFEIINLLAVFAIPLALRLEFKAN